VPVPAGQPIFYASSYIWAATCVRVPTYRTTTSVRVPNRTASIELDPKWDVSTSVVFFYQVVS